MNMVFTKKYLLRTPVRANTKFSWLMGAQHLRLMEDGSRATNFGQIQDGAPFLGKTGENFPPQIIHLFIGFGTMKFSPSILGGKIPLFLETPIY